MRILCAAAGFCLIDCDAVRPSGVSSSDSEHDAVLKKARSLKDILSEIGWPDPIMTDSGNGAQLMYRIELPAADGDLIHDAVLQKPLLLLSPKFRYGVA